MMLIGLVGYGFAALAFGILTLLALTSWRGRLQGGLFVAAAALSVAWAAAASFNPVSPQYWQWVATLEVLRNTAWLVFVARLAPTARVTQGLPRNLVTFAPAAFVIVYGLGNTIAASGADATLRIVSTLVTVGLLTAISGLVMLEQVYRSLGIEGRKAALPLIVGLGGLFAYDLFLYSHGLLFKGIQSDLWTARGFASLLAVPFLLLAARRNPAWSVDVFVSRQAAFYTTTMVAIGIYLVVMAIAAYGLRIVGGQWGTVLQVVFLFGAVVLLAWIVFSPSARAGLKVFLAKHFYSNKYDYREEWLKLTQRLAEGDETEPLPARGLGALVELVGADGGALWLSDNARDTEGYRRGAVRGTLSAAVEEGRLPAAISNRDSLVAFLADRRWTVNLATAVDDPESHPGLVVPEWLSAFDRNALVVPLLNQDQLLGIVLLIGPRRLGRLSYEDIDLFRVAGMQIAAVLAQAEADRLLTESRQFEAYNRFAAFIMHDLKNVIAQQSLVVRNAAKYRQDPAFIDDALDTVANSVDRMQRLLEQLRRGQGAVQVERVDVAALIGEVVSRHADRVPAPQAGPLDPSLRLCVDRERLAAVLGHLLTNAQDASEAGSRITIEAAMEDDWLVLATEDDGAGMDEEFVRNRLFRPFDSTKGSKGMGIGAYQARQFVEAVGGEVRVTSAPGQGTRFELRFPASIVEYAERESDATRVTGPLRTVEGGSCIG